MLNEKTDTLVNQKPTTARLNADIHIVLHTKIAQSLFNGSWKTGKIGLLQFAKMVSSIWHASKKDDPYADWYLLKTYQGLCDARDKLKNIEEKLTEKLNTIRGIEINTMFNPNPTNYSLHFYTPFGFMGAYLIADIDFVLRQFLLLERIGISLSQEDVTVKKLVSDVQNVFAIPRKYHRFDITRKDVIECSQRAIIAKEKLGEVPEVIFKKQIEFTFLPKKQKEENNAQ